MITNVLVYAVGTFIMEKDLALTILGMVGFYRKLIPHFADIVFPLTEKIKNNPKATTLIFNTQQLESFNTMKQNLAEVSTQPYPDSSCTNYHVVSVQLMPLAPHYTR